MLDSDYLSIYAGGVNNSFKHEPDFRHGLYDGVWYVCRREFVKNQSIVENRVPRPTMTMKANERKR